MRTGVCTRRDGDGYTGAANKTGNEGRGFGHANRRLWDLPPIWRQIPHSTCKGGPGAPLRARGHRRATDPLEPARGLLELLHARQCLGTRPHSVEALDSGLRGHRVAECLAQLVLAELELHAEQPRDDLAEAAAARPSHLEPIAKPRVSGLVRGAREVH